MPEHKIIAFANQKGGVGKTTSAVNIASSLAAKKYSVLLVDCDPQGNATSGLGIRKKSSSGSVYDVIIGRSKTADMVCSTTVKNLSVLPSSMDLVGAEIELIDMADREARLRAALEQVRDSYDFIIIDCPPSLGLLTLNCLTAADGVVIPLLCEFYSLEGISQLTQTIRHVAGAYRCACQYVRRQTDADRSGHGGNQALFRRKAVCPSGAAQCQAQ